MNSPEKCLGDKFIQPKISLEKSISDIIPKEINDTETYSRLDIAVGYEFSFSILILNFKFAVLFTTVVTVCVQETYILCIFKEKRNAIIFFSTVPS